MKSIGRHRATFALRGSSGLSPDEILDIVEAASNAAPGSSGGRRAAGIGATGGHVNIHRRTPRRIDLSLTCGAQMVEVGRLLAEVQPGPGGRTELCIAGLVGRRSYQTQSDGGTRSGIELYEWFLTSVDDQLRAADSSARLEMGQA